MWSCSERGLEPPSRRRAPSERENNAPPTCAVVLRRVRSTHLILVVWRSSALLGVPWRFHSLRRLLRATHGWDAANSFGLVAMGLHVGVSCSSVLTALRDNR